MPIRDWSSDVCSSDRLAARSQVYGQQLAFLGVAGLVLYADAYGGAGLASERQGDIIAVRDAVGEDRHAVEAVAEPARSCFILRGCRPCRRRHERDHGGGEQNPESARLEARCCLRLHQVTLVPFRASADRKSTRL